MVDIIIPTDKNPTPVERSAWVGAAWGTLLGIIPNVMATAVNPLLGFPVTGASIAIGYFLGRNKGENQQAQELRSGHKAVKEPTYWNRDLARGWVLSTLLNGATIFLMHKFAPEAGIYNPAMILASLTGIGIMIGGSIHGKNQMEAEYSAARSIDDRERVKAIAADVRKGLEQQTELGTTPNAPTFTAAEEKRRTAQENQPETSR